MKNGNIRKMMKKKIKEENKWENEKWDYFRFVDMCELIFSKYSAIRFFVGALHAISCLKDDISL